MREVLKWVMAILFAFGFWVGSLWLFNSKPPILNKEVPLCPTVQSFQQVKPSQLLPSERNEEDLDWFCGFTFEQGYFAIDLTDSQVKVVLSGQLTDNRTLQSIVVVETPAFYELSTSPINQGDRIEIEYQRNLEELLGISWILVGILAGFFGWGIGELLYAIGNIFFSV